MQILNFIPPRYDSFLKTIRSLWEQKIRTIQLIGSNFLANRIEKAAQKEKIFLSRNMSVKRVEAIIFTETSGELLSSQLLNCVEMD